MPIALQRKDVVTIAIGLGKKIKTSELKEIADGKKENVYSVKRFDELKANFKKMIDNICESPKPKPRPKVNPKPPGLHSRYLIYLHSSPKSKYVFDKNINSFN